MGAAVKQRRQRQSKWIVRRARHAPVGQRARGGDKDGGDVVRTNCEWSRNKNYLVRTFTASVEGNINLTGMQFIGWDAARKQIRSWVFDSDGGFAEGVWTKKGDRWMIRTTATLPDGKLASSTSIIQPLDGNQFSWQKVSRVVDGEILPNIEPVVIVRL